MRSGYFVGIDLGTTHTVVAYASKKPSSSVLLFDIAQMVSPGVVAEKPLLPSVRYHPAVGELDLSEKYLMTAEGALVGEGARLLGSKVQGRLVTSAKSWLSHPTADPTVAILPWGSDDSVPKISPLDASASYLLHIRTVWNQKFPKDLLEHQDVVITIPASFDDEARKYTQMAAQKAGLHRISLLEEPQAVCYDWLNRHENELDQKLHGIQLMLVCDIGGGTTDLSLIQVEGEGKKRSFKRIAVGNHLLLGGDNMDLSLGHYAERQLRHDTQKLSASEFLQVIEQCRQAKEQLLVADAAPDYPVTILGAGSKLIGNSRSIRLSRQLVEDVVLDGFFPIVPLEKIPSKPRSGMVEFGLPYAAEPAISRQIADFLLEHWHVLQGLVGKEQGLPDAVLLNGGIFRSEKVVERIQTIFKSWCGQRDLVFLENISPELAVAYGAVSFAKAKAFNRSKIGGGAPRSYFLAIDTNELDKTQVVCILPKSTPEDVVVPLTDRQFALRVGQPVIFHIYSTTSDTVYHPGQLLNLDTERFHCLPPLMMALEGHQKDEVLVALSTTYTEIGTLNISCVSELESERRWHLEFLLKSHSVPAASKQLLPEQFPVAAQKISEVFGAKSKQIDPKAVKTLRADLEKILGSSRSEWSTALIRELFQLMMSGVKYRRRSEAHERLWLSLTGFFLRPGYGYPLDEWRIDEVWPLYQEGLQFVNEKQNWAEWWTFWRRVACGLSVERQTQIYGDIAKYLNPVSARQPAVAKQSAVRNFDEMVRLAGVLEHLPVDDKILLGGWLIGRLAKAADSDPAWWSLGRIGSRVMLSGYSHEVVPPLIVSDWVESLLAMNWKGLSQAGFTATLLARRTDDRVLDISEELRAKLLEKLKQFKSPQSWLELVSEYKELDHHQQKQIFGEALPPGLKLMINVSE